MRRDGRNSSMQRTDPMTVHLYLTRSGSDDRPNATAGGVWHLLFRGYHQNSTARRACRAGPDSHPSSALSSAGALRALIHGARARSTSPTTACWSTCRWAPCTTCTVTAYGRACGWSQTDYPTGEESCTSTRNRPITPLVVSTAPSRVLPLPIHEPDSMVHLPAVAFRSCSWVSWRMIQNSAPSVIRPARAYLTCGVPADLKEKKQHTKMVNWLASPEFLYRTIKNGLFIGKEEGFIFRCHPRAA